MNSLIGALIAGIIAFITGGTALMMGEVCTVTDGVEVCRSIQSVSEISQVQWLILAGGAMLTFLKDWQAISVRRGINKVTKTGDGGGTV